MSNRLADATSPYLLQHRDNPVDWWEWGEEAFAEARRRNLPILLSVGYAACHWCHVMAHESFEDQATADYLNQHFVNVKVDREERPDIDAVYMAATVAMTGSGGWPMTCVLDHEGVPFFTGTYFPKQAHRGQTSFLEVLEALTEAWQQRPDDVRRVANTLHNHLAVLNADQPKAVGPIDESVLTAAVATLAGDFDPRSAGFGGAPKFPPSMVLEFLAIIEAPEARDMLLATCEAMARGGLYDQLRGGFARYAVDRDWVVPHFEKMLYDNALLLGVYARLDTALAERVTRESAEFLVRELRTAEGGFAASLDADSDGAEGTFYVWTPEQLREVLGVDDGAWAAEVFTVTDRGTFEHGSSTLQLRADPHDWSRFATVQQRLRAAQDRRVRPDRDDKIVAAWNGLAISALCTAGARWHEPRWIEAARQAAELVLRVHLVDGRLRRVSKDGVVGAAQGVLDDYGCLAQGLLDLTQVTADPRYLKAAEGLLDTAMSQFRAADGGFFDTAADAEQLVVRPRETSDNATPSGTAATAGALLTYAALTGSQTHRQAAEQVISSAGSLMRQAPRFAGRYLAVAQAMALGPEEIAVVGSPGGRRTALAQAARRRPGAVVVEADGPVPGIPLLDDRTASTEEPLAYVCRNQVCQAPVSHL